MKFTIILPFIILSTFVATAQKKVVFDINAGINTHYTNYKILEESFNYTDPFADKKLLPKKYFPAVNLDFKYFVFKNKPNLYLTNQLQLLFNEYKYVVAQFPVQITDTNLVYQNFYFTSRSGNIGLYTGIGNKIFYGRNKKPYIMVDGGVVLGVNMETGKGVDVKFNIDPRINYEYGYVMEDKFRNNFLMSIQGKFEIHPIAKLTNLGIGFMPSVNLTRSPKVINQGYFVNNDTNFRQDFYGVTNSWSFNFYSYLSWSFYKIQTKKRQQQKQQ